MDHDDGIDHAFKEELEKQIEEQMKKAFYDLLEEDLAKDPPNTTHLKILVDEIMVTMCQLIPNRPDAQQYIRNELAGEITWDFQLKLLKLIEKLQAPHHDAMTRNWKTKVPQKISDFLPKFYDHLENVVEETKQYREYIRQGKPLVNVKGSNGVPDNMKSGFR